MLFETERNYKWETVHEEEINKNTTESHTAHTD